MDDERVFAAYDGLVLPYVLAFAVLTVGVGVGFVYPALIATMTPSAGTLFVRWVGVLVGLLVASAVVWWLILDGTRAQPGGAALLALAVLAEAIGGGWLVMRSTLATSAFALGAAGLTAVSLLLTLASVVFIALHRERYGRPLVMAHVVLALLVPVALIVADRALPLEPDPVVGLVFVIVPFVALLLVANAVLVRIWREQEPRRHHRPARGM